MIAHLLYTPTGDTPIIRDSAMLDQHGASMTVAVKLPDGFVLREGDQGKEIRDVHGYACQIMRFASRPGLVLGWTHVLATHKIASNGLPESLELQLA
jgi:hypothetical protein